MNNNTAFSHSTRLHWAFCVLVNPTPWLFSSRRFNILNFKQFQAVFGTLIEKLIDIFYFFNPVYFLINQALELELIFVDGELWSRLGAYCHLDDVIEDGQLIFSLYNCFWIFACFCLKFELLAKLHSTPALKYSSSQPVPVVCTRVHKMQSIVLIRSWSESQNGSNGQNFYIPHSWSNPWQRKVK